MQIPYLTIDQKTLNTRKQLRRLPFLKRHQIEEKLITSLNYHDHILEGTTLSQTDIAKRNYEEVGRNFCEERVFRSLRRTQGTYQYLWESSLRKVPSDLKLTKKIHILISEENQETAGRYRKDDSVLGNYLHNILSAKTISYHLRKLLSSEKLKRMHPLVSAAHFHHRFMEIFPFDNQSGRVGRMLMNYRLLQSGYLPIVIHGNHRSEYYDTLRFGPNRILPLLTKCMNSVLDSLENNIEQQPTEQRLAFS